MENVWLSYVLYQCYVKQGCKCNNRYSLYNRHNNIYNSYRYDNRYNIMIDMMIDFIVTDIIINIIWCTSYLT